MGGSVPKPMAAKNFQSKVKGVKTFIDQVETSLNEEVKDNMAESTEDTDQLVTENGTKVDEERKSSVEV